MSGKIEPALTAGQWGPMPPRVANYTLSNGAIVHLGPREIGIQDNWGEAAAAPLAAVIALANHALPDSDPRKITRTQINALRFAAVALREKGEKMLAAGISPGIEDEQAFTVDKLADALESYLPPEAPL
jgi:hypothetical protein